MITVLLFAQLQEEAGRDRIELEIDAITVGELRNELLKIYSLTGIRQAMVAINEEYALDEDTIVKGDTVAFIPPVSGG